MRSRHRPALPPRASLALPSPEWARPQLQIIGIPCPLANAIRLLPLPKDPPPRVPMAQGPTILPSIPEPPPSVLSRAPEPQVVECSIPEMYLAPDPPLPEPVQPPAPAQIPPALPKQETLVVPRTPTAQLVQPPPLPPPEPAPVQTPRALPKQETLVVPVIPPAHVVQPEPLSPPEPPRVVSVPPPRYESSPVAPAGESLVQAASDAAVVRRRAEKIYRSVFGHDPDPRSLRAAIGLLADGLKPEELRAVLFGSDEFMVLRGGGTESGFVAAVVRAVTGRTIDSVSLDRHLRTLAEGKARAELAYEILWAAETDGAFGVDGDLPELSACPGEATEEAARAAALEEEEDYEAAADRVFASALH